MAIFKLNKFIFDKVNNLSTRHYILLIAFLSSIIIFLTYFILSDLSNYLNFQLNPREHSVITFKTNKVRVLRNLDIINGNGIPNASTKLNFTPGKFQTIVKTDNKGKWQYVVPENLKNGRYKLTIEYLDKNNRVASLKNYKVRVINNDLPTFIYRKIIRYFQPKNVKAETTNTGYCPSLKEINRNRQSPETCRYFNPPIDIFNNYISLEDYRNFINTYKNEFIGKDLGFGKTGTLEEFERRTNYIIDRSQDVLLNPVIFLGYWKSESNFSTEKAADLGCDPETARQEFEKEVDCALGLSRLGGSLAARCASPNNPKRTEACNQLKAIRSKHPDKYANYPISYPIATFDDLVEAIGPKAPNLDGPGKVNNNCTHTYNTLVEVSIMTNSCGQPVAKITQASGDGPNGQIIPGGNIYLSGLLSRNDASLELQNYNIDWFLKVNGEDIPLYPPENCQQDCDGLRFIEADLTVDQSFQIKMMVTDQTQNKFIAEDIIEINILTSNSQQNPEKLEEGSNEITPSTYSCLPIVDPYGECDWGSNQVYDFQTNPCTGEIERYNYHLENGVCGYFPDSQSEQSNNFSEEIWEGPGCIDNKSVWGIWSVDGSRLIEARSDPEIIPNECGN